jgi:hypothetical protein
LRLEIQKQFRNIFEETTAVWSEGTEKPFIEMEESNINAAKDTAYESRKICLPNHFPFLQLFETKVIGIQERLILRVQLFLGSIKKVQQGTVILTECGRRVSGYDL